MSEPARGRAEEINTHNSKPPCSFTLDAITSKIKVSECYALHSCKTLCPGIAETIGPEMELSQRSALRQHSCKTVCPGCSNEIAAEIEVHQLPALS